MAGPIIESVAQKVQGKAKVFKLNVDENPLTAGEYGISGIPTMLIFRNGAVITQLVGVQQESVYIDALN
jgi:thioredoxin 1